MIRKRLAVLIGIFILMGWRTGAIRSFCGTQDRLCGYPESGQRMQRGERGQEGAHEGGGKISAADR